MNPKHAALPCADPEAGLPFNAISLAKSPNGHVYLGADLPETFQLKGAVIRKPNGADWEALPELNLVNAAFIDIAISPDGSIVLTGNSHISFTLASSTVPLGRQGGSRHHDLIWSLWMVRGSNTPRQSGTFGGRAGSRAAPAGHWSPPVELIQLPPLGEVATGLHIRRPPDTRLWQGAHRVVFRSLASRAKRKQTDPVSLMAETRASCTTRRLQRAVGVRRYLAAHFR